MSTYSQDVTDSAQSLTQAERTAISDKAMMNAAIELILERGTDKTTFQAISERSGYSRGLVTYRFGSKAGLFEEICKSISRHWLEYVNERVGDKVGIDAMCTALDAFSQFVCDSPREARIVQILYCGAASPASGYSQTPANIHQRQQDDVADWVRAGIESGEIRKDVDPKRTAVQYIAYISGMRYLWLLNPDSLELEKANEDMKEHLERSLKRVTTT